MTFLDNVHPEWLAALNTVKTNIEDIDALLLKENFQPPAFQVLRALEYPLSKVRVVIFGQDPYPTPGYATGLSFSVSQDVTSLPRSLRNIFSELSDDVGCAMPKNGDLSRWAEQGVALINRVLTVNSGGGRGHQGLGWEKVTDEIARVLGEKEVVAILWGNRARELAHFFRDEWVVTSAHPSPLSAHRGFFGSRPFSKTNAILRVHDLVPVDWCG